MERSRRAATGVDEESSTVGVLVEQRGKVAVAKVDAAREEVVKVASRRRSEPLAKLGGDLLGTEALAKTVVVDLAFDLVRRDNELLGNRHRAFPRGLAFGERDLRENRFALVHRYARRAERFRRAGPAMVVMDRVTAGRAGGPALDETPKALAVRRRVTTSETIHEHAGARSTLQVRQGYAHRRVAHGASGRATGTCSP